jgi:hypothetical protein
LPASSDAALPNTFIPQKVQYLERTFSFVLFRDKTRKGRDGIIL